MPSLQETAYPRLKSNPTLKELDKLFSPNGYVGVIVTLFQFEIE